jgi:tetratricopeptide (TPR) repeat protein
VGIKLLKNHFFSGEFELAFQEDLNLEEKDKLIGSIFISIIKTRVESSSFAIELARKNYEKANLSSDQTLMYVARIALSWTYEFGGESKKGLEAIEEAENILEFLTNEEYSFVEEWVSLSLALKAWNAFITGNVELGIKIINEGIIKAEEVGIHWFKQVALEFQGWMYFHQNEIEKSKNIAEKILSDPKIEKNWSSDLYFLLGLCYYRSDHLTTSLDHYLKGLELVEKSRDIWQLDNILTSISKIYRKIDDSAKFDEFINDKLSQYKENNFERGLIRLYAALDDISRDDGNYKKSIEYRRKMLEIQNRISHKLDIAYSYEMIGSCSRNLGDFETAFEYYDKSYLIVKNYGDKNRLSLVTGHKGSAHLKMGNLEKALILFRESLSLLDEVGMINNKSVILGWTGDLYRLKGEFEEALNHYEMSFNVVKTWNKFNPTRLNSLYNLGNIHQHLRHYETAKDYYNQSLIGFQKNSNDNEIARVLYSLVSLSLEIENMDEANKYFDKFKELSNQKSYPHMLLRFKLSEAMILKHSNRMSQKSQALELFKEITEQPVIIHNLTVFAMLNLCELLIAELRSFGNEEVLIEVKELSQKLYKIARHQHSYFLLIETLFLQAKLALIEFDIELSQQLLVKASKIAEDKKMVILLDKVKQEREKFVIELKNWKSYADQNIPLTDRIKYAELQEYIETASKLQPEMYAGTENDEAVDSEIS